MDHAEVRAKKQGRGFIRVPVWQNSIAIVRVSGEAARYGVIVAA
jgi:hypothetical protein